MALDYVQTLNDAIWTLVLPLVPAQSATIDASERNSEFKKEIYRAVNDDPTFLIEFTGDTIRNPYVTFNSTGVDFTMRGRVNFDAVVKVRKAGSEAVSTLMNLVQKGLFASYPTIGITTFRVVDFQFNPSNRKMGRNGVWHVYRSPISFDVRIKRSALTA